MKFENLSILHTRECISSTLKSKMKTKKKKKCRDHFEALSKSVS